jgi:hypothetical protein
MNKLLVGSGVTKNGKTGTVEIIDLESPHTTCKNLKNFPLPSEGPLGGLGFQDEPMICGGRENVMKYYSNCFTLKNNEWTSSHSLAGVRGFAAVSPSPYPTKTHKLFISERYTAEVLTTQGWKTIPQTIPVKIFHQCSVLFNSTTIMVIGGWQNDVISSNTFFFNTENEVWSKGPQLKKERASLSCGRIKKNRLSQEFSIIAAAGGDGPLLSSVEILDQGSNRWREGPALPFGIGSSQLVEDQKGGVILVAGESSSNGYLDKLYQLPHGGVHAEWRQMQQKIKVGRRYHVAFLVPDNIADCS